MSPEISNRSQPESCASSLHQASYIHQSCMDILLRMGAFHIICNALAILGKRFRDAGLKDICIEAGIGSINGVTSRRPQLGEAKNVLVANITIVQPHEALMGRVCAMGGGKSGGECYDQGILRQGEQHGL